MTRDEQAIGWHIRQRDMSAAEWEAFATWLEDSPANARAYDAVAMADAALVAPMAKGTPSVATEPADRAVAANDNAGWGRWWLVGGVAAAVALVAGPMALHSRPDIRIEQTAPGEVRTIALNDGTRVEMAGGTRLRFDRHDTRVATLEAGQALFHVRHDPSAPFELRSGDVTIRDMGTVFDVRRSPGRLDVAVAEGAVALSPPGRTLALTAGQGASLDEARHIARRTTIDPTQVGGWRDGMLDFDRETVAAIAGRLQSAYGVRIAVEGPLGERSVTGLIRMSGDAGQDVPRLAKLIGAEWRQSGGEWTLRASKGDR
ncbi:FecR domain-containing protein [Sphingomonas sp.]|uniref:FecR family protein n=1 Tax=Sphingomonas sp. TaxID=28214 RepID=UPI0031CEE32E